MSELTIFVETLAGAGWLFLGALGILALGCLVFDRRVARRRTRTRDAARPGERRAA